MNTPFFIQWHITDACNLRCRHCYQDKFTGERDLPVSSLLRIVKNICSTMEKWDNSTVINITGGEPFLKKELYPILYLLNKENRVEELSIITNGTLLSENSLKKLSQFKKIHTLKVSVDGGKEITNDSIRGKGSFKKCIEKIKSIKDNYNFNIILMYTLMKKNLGEIPDLIELALSLNIDGIILERFIPIGRGGTIKKDLLSKSDWKYLLVLLSDIFHIEDISELISYQAFYIKLDNNGPELLGAPCVLGKDGLCIMPDGSVYPCRRFPLPIGNLCNETLDHIWKNSPLLRILSNKRTIKGKCRVCPIDSCTGCRSLALAFTGDYLAEDPHCLLE